MFSKDLNAFVMAVSCGSTLQWRLMKSSSNLACSPRLRSASSLLASSLVY